MDIIKFITLSLAIVHTVMSVQEKTIDDTSNGTLVYEVPLLFNESLEETSQASVLSVIDLPVNTTKKPPVTETRDPSVIVTIESLVVTTTELPLTTTEPPMITEPTFTKNLEPLVSATNDSSEITDTDSPTTIITELPVTTSTEQPMTLNTEQQFSKTTDPLEVTTNDSSVATTSELPVTTNEEPPLWVRQLIEKQRLLDSPNATTTETTEFNPCLQEGPEMPDFRAPGRRISEIKCKEYIWNVEERQILGQQFLECQRYKASRLELNEFAVAGGRNAIRGEFPHMAAIGWRGKESQWVFKCGSTLISSKFVLTAAHCTKVSSRDDTVTDPLPKIVRMGVTDIEHASYFPPNDYGIIRIIVHPQYKAPKQYYDIALMELNFEIQPDVVLHPACLWSNFDTSELGTKASVTGWGVLKSVPIPNTGSPVLQVGEVDIIDSQTCDDLLRPYCNRKQCGIQDHQICAGILAGGVDACQGDSGGPLQVKISLPNNEYEDKMYYVIGVTSYGIGCALENSPGVYTRASSFIDWIEEIVWPQ